MIKLALRNLTRRRTRTLLTILGVAVAITFTVGLLSITEGFMNSFNQTTRERKEDIYVLPGQARGSTSPLLESTGAVFPQAYIDDILKIDNVKAVYPIYTRSIYLGDASDSLMGDFVVLNGVTPQFLPDLRPSLELEDGRLFEEGEDGTIVVGAAVAEAQGLKVGDTFPLGVEGYEIKIVGILKSTGGFEDMIAYAPLQDVQLALNETGRITSAAVTVKDRNKTKETADAITALHPEDIVGRTTEELAGVVRNLLSMARAIHLSVASIALLIGVLFILSTMLMAVSERTKEIGTMRAMGVRRATIFRLIITESLITCIIAGGLGCLVGVGLSKVITWAIHRFAGVAFLQAVVSPGIFGAGLLIAVLIGALAGLYPAWRISKINIVEALRYE
jgi:putative ABC transport system permease protein